MRRISLVVATALAAATFAAAPAHADQTFTGSLTTSDPQAVITQPDDTTQACSFAGGATAPAYVDQVTLPAQIAGTRSFVLHVGSTSMVFAVLYVYRNGVCVGADYTPDNAQEASAGVIDVDGITFAAGDNITVKVAGVPPLDWSLTVVQPEPVKGSARSAASGRGAKFVTLPAAMSCQTHSAVLKFSRKAKRSAAKAVVRANGKKVKQIRTFKPRKRVVVKRLPAGATLSVVVKLKNGKKATVRRSYWSC
ncbi:hypothetical protein SAMN04487968_12210 [Nocardioides terrae]|uniref:Secreted protein n=1 Tax=Nocardioides terrae TaxID=574651 RepID=A0A1I1NXH5_9ACTN|nr:hypothetical protein [Nocardioides terrae]SFD02106.1 hypothetical protein SAMN04487968_12210 [Nocardioides terrae]